jgi:hypothetical protein
MKIFWLIKRSPDLTNSGLIKLKQNLNFKIMTLVNKKTKKEKILKFVEEKGECRFSEIQKFIVEMNYGKGAYDEKVLYYTYDRRGNKTVKTLRRWRGYYCTALSFGMKGHLVTGKNRLGYNTNTKQYYVIRR